MIFGNKENNGGLMLCSGAVPFGTGFKNRESFVVALRTWTSVILLKSTVTKKYPILYLSIKINKNLLIYALLHTQGL